jgi:hypothetical protein
MALQTFTAGQILTAAQVTALQANDYNQTVSNKVASYVLVAADKGTRVTMSNAAATTVTVNTSLFTAGDTLFIQNIGAGVCTITAGTATVTTASSLALAQWQGGTLYFTSASAAIFFPSDKTVSNQGLTVVKAETAFSAVSSFTADGVFTSAYTNYLLLVNFTTVSGGVTVQLRTGGVASTASYNYQALVLSGATVSGIGSSAQTAFNVGSIGNNVAIPIELYGPQLTVPTSYYSKNHQNATITNAWQYWGAHNVSTAYDGVGVSFTTGTGTYSIYGYGKTA